MKATTLIKESFSVFIDDLMNYRSRRHFLPRLLFLLMCLNLVITPAVYAATDGAVDRRAIYMLGLLGILTLAISLYLFVVIFQPERF